MIPQDIAFLVPCSNNYCFCAWLSRFRKAGQFCVGSIVFQIEFAEILAPFCKLLTFCYFQLHTHRVRTFETMHLFGSFTTSNTHQKCSENEKYNILSLDLIILSFVTSGGSTKTNNNTIIKYSQNTIKVLSNSQQNTD